MFVIPRLQQSHIPFQELSYVHRLTPQSEAALLTSINPELTPDVRQIRLLGADIISETLGAASRKLTTAEDADELHAKIIAELGETATNAIDGLVVAAIDVDERKKDTRVTVSFTDESAEPLFVAQGLVADAFERASGLRINKTLPVPDLRLRYQILTLQEARALNRRTPFVLRSSGTIGTSGMAVVKQYHHLGQ